ncbi:MAG: cytochrome c assembly protein [Sphingobacteriales bacterium]|nr:MAG: cytochrome c assembly protein [Sphingobacteriales bacterium]
MNFIGEHLFPGQLGHFFVIFAFIASLLSTIAFFISSGKIQTAEHQGWLRFARAAFLAQVAALIIVFSTVFYICANHLYEYMYAYKHASLELEKKYLLACIWEGQEGSFLLWAICHALFGSLIIFRRKSDMLKGWEAPVMTVISLAQFFLLLMILGIYVGDTRIGNSLFTLTRNEINAPIFEQANYLNFVKDGMGLNILLRNYWMVIHPPVLFMGFASTIIPFAFAYAGIRTQRYGDWVKPALPWALASACILGVGIMMGGKWAYESLSFGGYWAWDPVENASLVPWLILIAGLHTMVVYKSTGHSLRASYLFAILTFCFVLYSTFLTRTGVLGDTSVHSFTEAGKAINIMIGMFVLSFAVPSLVLFFANYKKIPTIHKEENTNSREFWMFIGSLVFFLTAIFIIVKTSVPVINYAFGTKIAPPEDVEFSYNKVGVLIAFIIGLLTAFSQYLKYKSTDKGYTLKRIALPTLAAAMTTLLLAVFYPITYNKQGIGFLIAIYAAIFATVYALIANASYIWIVLKGKVLHGGGSIAHAGFALMIFGMLVSSGNKKVISSSMVNGITMPAGEDPMTKEKDNPRENLTLIRQVPTAMGEYEVTYFKDSSGKEKGRKFYNLLFERKDEKKNVKESFVLQPDVYMMKDNNFSSNPDTRSYFTKDVFTYLSYALNNEAVEDTAQFRIVEMHEGDTAFYTGGYVILNKVVKNPNNSRYKYKPTDVALMADITVVGKDSVKRSATPLIEVDSLGVINYDDTVYAQNLYLRFAGVGEKHHIKVGIKESDQLIDFVTVKAYIFPLVNLVWTGLIIMAIGLVVSMLQRGKFKPAGAAIILLLVSVALIYMFLFANN